MVDPERRSGNRKRPEKPLPPLSDLVNLEQVRRLLYLTHRAMGVPAGIVDPCGTPILSVGAQEICRDFHWTHPETRRRCHGMDARLGRETATEGYTPYRCQNGLWHIAMPLVIQGTHYATLFLGQFFYDDEPVNTDLFRRRARELGFDEEKYLSALARVPVYSQGKVNDIMGFYAALLAHLSELGHTNLRLTRQIEERKKAEAALRRSEDRYRRYFEEDLSGSYISTPEGRLIACNSAFVGIFGLGTRENAYTVDLEDLYPAPADRAAFIDKLRRDRKLERYESIMRRADGTAIHILENCVGTFDPKGDLKEIKGFLMDITEQKQLEAKLRQSMKMEAIGTLAGGIAHDFNNILGAIMGYTEMASFDAPEGGRQRRWLEGILNAAERARDLVSQILTFSRRKERERLPILITPILKESVKLLRATLPATIELAQRIEHHADLILADPTQIHQVVMNLCTNAHHAMAETGGKLIVSMERESVSEPGGDHGLVPGTYLRLTVEDTGCGMDPATLEKIFDPFFTTKEPGMGTGMGMALVQGIIREHNGEIEVISTPGEGTTVSVWFPVVKAAEHARKPETSPLPTGDERILIIDDETVLADLGTQMLQRLGYEVTCAVDPRHALSLFQENPDGFDLVITDMTMPHLTGDRLAKALLEIRPTLPIILCTGFSEWIDPEKADRIGIRELAMKPLSIAHLARSIRRALASGPVSPAPAEK